MLGLPFTELLNEAWQWQSVSPYLLVFCSLRRLTVPICAGRAEAVSLAHSLRLLGKQAAQQLPGDGMRKGP